MQPCPQTSVRKRGSLCDVGNGTIVFLYAAGRMFSEQKAEINSVIFDYGVSVFKTFKV